MLRWVALIACSLVIMWSAWVAITLDHSRLTEYGWGYFTGQVLLVLLALGGLILSLRSFRSRARS